MKNLSKIRLKDISNKQTLEVDQLSKITGGVKIALYNGCDSGICDNNRAYGSDQFCSGSATCTNGIGVCNEKT